MAQVKVFALRDSLATNRSKLSNAIHDAIVSALSFPAEKKFQRFIALDHDDFVFPADRSEHYTIIEISMFEGRTIEAKKALIRALFDNIERDVGIRAHDVEITLFETPKHNWGIRGMPADELTLNYKVNV
jgi:phenylpyruvate tautomerase PptA (4-oxalocrotonate tautomerase family)